MATIQNRFILVGTSYREVTAVDVESTDAAASDVVTRDVDS